MVNTWGVTPRHSVLRECSRRGRPAFVAGCRDLLSGRGFDAELLQVLAGPAAQRVLGGGAGGPGGYWPRVWALRGLLYAWEDGATGDVVAALHDESWRVREMAAKVVAAQKVTEATTEIILLQEDHIPRVRRAAGRALMRLST